MRRKQRKRRLLSLLSSLSSSLPPISLSMIIIIILLYQQLLIGGINAMASNPYVSGIKLPGNQIEDQTFYGEIKSLIGGRVELPCNLTLPSSDDAIQLIFWHRGNNTRVPIYTVDGRASQTLSNATHFLSDIFQPNRAIFNLQSNPSKLIIDPVFETDHNDYRCRVDFRWGRTINSFVTLHVIVPPKKITIRDQNGNYIENSTIGPYDQNTDVILTCESNGGIPPPTLQWYKNGVMIDGSYIVSDNGLVSNELIIYKISTHDLYDKYVCQAGNYNSSSTIPIEAYVILDINLLPIDVQILTNRTKLLAGRKIDINCQTYGSKPAAIIKWFHNDKQLITPNSIESYESNKTFSSITFKPTVYDNGSLLKCRAYNPRIQLNKKFSTTTTTNTTATITAENIDDENRNYIESIWRLEVLYSPQVILRIRKFNNNNNNNDQHSMSSSSTLPTSTTTTIMPLSISSPTTTMMVINEQTTLLIECFINANPSLVDVQILHNSTIIQLNKQLDVQEQNVTKILIESVNANHRGRYQCMAINQQGMSRSNAIQLNVQYVPFCNDPYLNPNKSGSGDNNGMRITTTLATATINQQNNHHHNHNQQYALAINESIRLKCDVQSNPIAINYYWTLNNVDDDNDNDNDNNNDDEWLDETKIIAQSRHEYDNELLYQIKTKNDYGKLSCWAENRIGIQRQPCSFRIQKAGPPSSLNDCSVTNKTTTSLTIECYPGDNGGSRQIFFANVYQYKQIDDDDDDIDNEDENENESLIDNKQSILKIKTAGNSGVNNLISIHHRKEMINKKINLTSETSPIFYLNNLQPGTKYHLELYAQNERGQSDFERLTVTTLFTKNTKLISSSLQEYEYESWYSMMFISILFTILLIVIIVYIVCRLRQRQISRKNRRKEEQIKQK
uniref:Nephrin-like n=1 Tax=Dermatophagoides pteronyssinus TaxID=6956 RepID=A0A6P6Y2M1_DERPT|nr:nephrin-like [Dermatophagoides pteronyssinus]